MRWKSTLVLLLLTVGIGAYVSLVELKQPTVEEREELAKEVVRLDEDAVTGLQVTGPSGAFALAKDKDAWRLTSPRAARADGNQVRRLLYQLDPLESERALTPDADKPLALADFGLEPPKASLTATEGTKTMTLLFGDKTPVGDNRYLKLEGKPEIFVTGNGLFDAIDEPWESYRSKTILDMDSSAIAQVSVQSSSGSYTLRQDGERWQLTDPVEDQADSAAASAVISTLRGLRAEQFVADEPSAEQLAAWGLEPASEASPESDARGTTVIRISTEGREQPLEVRVGSPLADRPEELHVKRADEPFVYAVKNESFDEILKDPPSLRAREVLDVAPADVTKVRLEWQGSSWTIERQDGQWRATEAGTALDQSKVEDWLWKLRGVQLIRFIDDAPQDLQRFGFSPTTEGSPEVRGSGAIRVWTTERVDAKEVLLGKAIEDVRSRYAALSERRGIVVELPESLELILITTPDSFLPTPASNASPEISGTAPPSSSSP